MTHTKSDSFPPPIPCEVQADLFKIASNYYIIAQAGKGESSQSPFFWMSEIVRQYNDRQRT